MNINSLTKLIIAAAIGGGITLIVTSMFSNTEDASMSSMSDTADQPLYWVAPMDANFRKDEPGLSPMGMDLIPFYGNTNSQDSPGTVKISPLVVNNLGVRTAKVKRGLLDQKISTVGYVQYNENRLIHIHPRIEGWVEKLYIKAAGDPVEKGQALYEIYSPALVNAQEELLLALERKNKRLIRAAEDRLQALQVPANAIKTLKRVRKVEQRVTFYAPQSGVVDNLNIREGFFVKPTKALMSIGQLDQVWVEAEVFERQVQNLAVNLPVTMTLGYLPGRTWQGEVDYIYPSLNAETRTVKVRLKFENQDNVLKPNMFAQIVIHSNDSKPTLLIPKQAVIRTGTQARVVLAFGEGKFKSVYVELGRGDDKSTEILSGLAAGESVVSSAQFLLDSESSKSSDFVRMDTNNTATVMGTVNKMMMGMRMINISRDGIEKWGRPAATVDFIVSDGLEWPDLEAGENIEFTFRASDGIFVITDLQSSQDAE